MRLALLESIKPPVFLARNIYDETGKIILTKGTLLNKQHLHRLKELRINSVYVDEGMVSLEVDEMVAEETRIHTMRITRDALLKVRAGESPEISKIRNYVTHIIEELMLNRNLMVLLIDIRSLKDHTFLHSVNVCVLSLLTGLAMGYKRIDLMELGMGALLHDVGKTVVFDAIVNKKEVIAEEEYKMMQEHAQYGYDILKKTDGINENVANVAYQHHERFDGSGYPRGLEAHDIMEFARIVAVADVFDAISTDRPYRERFLPHQVVEIIRDSIGTNFDPIITKKFIANIVPFPMGSMVLLNTGEKGLVSSIDKEFPARPRVQLLYDHNGNWFNEIQIVDLIQEQNKFVRQMIKE